jgi:hypothetical protein
LREIPTLTPVGRGVDQGELDAHRDTGPASVPLGSRGELTLVAEGRAREWIWRPPTTDSIEQQLGHHPSSGS